LTSAMMLVGFAFDSFCRAEQDADYTHVKSAGFVSSFPALLRAFVADLAREKYCHKEARNSLSRPRNLSFRIGLLKRVAGID
jgi:hypothetical protein